MSWNKPEELVPFLEKVAENIKKDWAAWLDQGLKLGCSVKYLNIRIDQRTGNFLVTGDTTPKASFPIYDVEHMYPNGWSSKDGINHILSQTVQEISDDLQLNLTKEQMVKMAKVVEKNITSAISNHSIEILHGKAITTEELQNNWNQK